MSQLPTEETNVPPENGTRSRFVFRGDHPVLDFINTRMVDAEGAPYDALKAYADWVDWLYATGFVAVDAATQMRAEPPDTQQAIFAEVHDLRDALRELMAAQVEMRPATPDALAVVNVVLCEGQGAYQLTQEAGGFHRHLERKETDLSTYCRVLLAESGAELLSGDQAQYVRQCESTDCVLFFLDVSKNHGRRWCSMASCGNRAKAAAFYARRKSKEKTA